MPETHSLISARCAVNDGARRRLLLALSTAWAATKEDDRVTSIPGFEAQFQKGLGFDVYSGYLDVQVPKAGQTTIRSRSTMSSTPAVRKDCPLALWHQAVLVARLFSARGRRWVRFN